MAYIGQSIKNGTFTDLGFSGTFNSSTTAFSLGTQVGSPAQLLVSKNGVIQRPGTDYTLSSGGASITFTTAPASGDSIFIVEISGAVGGPLGSDLNGSELILDADGDTSLHASTDDQIDVKIAGADDFKFTANSMNVLSGSTLTIDSGATITNSGTANGFGVGKIAQVKTAVYDTTGATTSSSSFVAMGLSVAITPSATSSKILVQVHGGSVYTANDKNGFFTIYRDSTNLGNTNGFQGHFANQSYLLGALSMSTLDSPSSTSAITYAVYVKTTSAPVGFQDSATRTVITAMEVLA